MKKALKKIAVMVTIVALTMGNSVLSAAESGFSTQFEVSDPNEVFWVADCTYLKAYQGRHYNVAASEIKSCVEGSYIIHA